MDNLPFRDDDDHRDPTDYGWCDPPPYEPTPEDLAEYAEWSARVNHPRPDAHPFPDELYCPADFGHYCEACDREMGEAMAREADAISDAWYLDLVARADFRHDGWRDSQ